MQLYLVQTLFRPWKGANRRFFTRQRKTFIF